MDELFDRFNSYPLAQKVLVFLIVVVVLFALFWFALYNPLRTEYQRAESKHRSLDSKREELEDELRDKVTREEIQQLRTEIQQAEKKLPSSAQYRGLLKSIHNKAKTAGLEILNFQPQTHRTKQYYVEIPVNMELRGSFGELTSFLSFVRGMDRIVAIQDLDMELKGRTSGDLVVKTTAMTYRYKEDDSGESNGGGGTDEGKGEN